MGLNRGHYISVVKSHGFWFLFDDEQVEVERKNKQKYLAFNAISFILIVIFLIRIENRSFQFRGILRLDTRHE